MASIGGIELKQRLEEGLASWLCKKNNYLCLGKNVNSINMNMLKIYNYWVITDQCELTDDEINCIVKDLKPICTFKKPQRDLTIVEPQNVITPTVVVTEYTRINVSITLERKVCPTLPSGGAETPTLWNADGEWDLKANPSGGQAPYTYQWDCIALPVNPINGVCGDGWYASAGETTDTLLLTNVLGRRAYKWRITITDALGNSAQDTYTINDSYTDSCYAKE